MSEIKNPHDAFFKQLFKRPNVMREFIENYLPAALVAALDTATVELVEGSFIDEELQEHLSDLIFRVQLKRGGQAFIYILFEHKSEADRWVAWQHDALHDAQVGRRENGGRRETHACAARVFYHGRARWRFGTEFGELVNFADVAELREYVPGHRVHLIDLSQYADAQIVGSRLLRFGLLLLKYIFRRREMNERVEEFFEIYRPLFSGSRWDFLFVGIKYLMSVSPAPLPRERLRAAVQKVFAEQEGEMIMRSVAEEWKKELRPEVVLEVRRELEPQMRRELELQMRREGVVGFVLEMLHKRVRTIDAATEKRIRALPLAQLEDLVIASTDFRTNKDLQTWLRAQPVEKE